MKFLFQIPTLLLNFGSFKVSFCYDGFPVSKLFSLLCCLLELDSLFDMRSEAPLWDVYLAASKSVTYSNPPPVWIRGGVGGGV